MRLEPQDTVPTLQVVAKIKSGRYVRIQCVQYIQVVFSCFGNLLLYNISEKMISILLLGTHLISLNAFMDTYANLLFHIKTSIFHIFNYKTYIFFPQFPKQKEATVEKELKFILAFPVVVVFKQLWPQSTHMIWFIASVPIFHLLVPKQKTDLQGNMVISN